MSPLEAPAPRRLDRPAARLRSSAAFGGIAWALVARPSPHFAALHSMLALGVLVVVPVTLSLVAPPRGRIAKSCYQAVTWLALPAAAAYVAASRWVQVGIPKAALATVPWLMLSLLVGVIGRAQLRAGGWRDPERLCVGVALLLFPVGALWLLADQWALQPFGVGFYLVGVTALHFHFAVLVTPVLGAQTLGVARHHRGGRESPLAWPMTVGVLGGPVLVAAGYLADPTLGLAGTLMLTMGMLAIAWLTLRHVWAATENADAKLLFGLGTAAILVSMPLACVWAASLTFGTRPLAQSTMMTIHGYANAFGFALCLPLGWIRRRGNG